MRFSILSAYIEKGRKYGWVVSVKGFNAFCRLVKMGYFINDEVFNG